MKKSFLFFFFAFLFFLIGNTCKVSAAYVSEGTAFYGKISPSSYVGEGVAFYANATQASGTLPVYRFNNTRNGDHFYTTSEEERTAILNNPQWGYTLEGIAFYANTTQITGTLPVYRFNNTRNGDHFYTTSEEERTAILNSPQWGYTSEGIAFYANAAQSADTFPVYRFYNASNGDHFYTISETEKNSLSVVSVYRFLNRINGDHFYTASVEEKNALMNNPQWGYVIEGVAFYAQNSPIDGTLPVYRFNNTRNGDHFYTISETEKNSLLNPQGEYRYEGIGFYAYATQVTGTSPVYRFNNPSTGDHFYTISESEKNYLLQTELGPEISVGLWYYGKTDIMSKPFQIDANKAYNIKDANGTILTQVGGNSTTKVNYNDPDNQLTVTVGTYTNNFASQTITFDAADGDNSTLVFNTHRSSYIPPVDWRGTIDRYRGKIKLQYFHDSNTSPSTQIWVVNILPLEQYTWGCQETSGTGNINHTRVMTTAFRTFGFRRLNSPLYTAFGFRVRSDSLDQTYGGYDWETKSGHEDIRTAAQQTRGVLVTYNGGAAITPYSSWSDGNTRTSSAYPWCIGKKDPYGDRITSNDSAVRAMSTQDLFNAGNNMIGLTGYGSVHMAEQGWDWQNILHYYYTNIGLSVNY